MNLSTCSIDRRLERTKPALSEVPEVVTFKAKRRRDGRCSDQNMLPKDDITDLKKLKQILTQSMQCVFHSLKECGVSQDSITALRQDVEKQQYHQVLLQAQEYVRCFCSAEDSATSSLLLITSWQALSRLNNVRVAKAKEAVEAIRIDAPNVVMKKATVGLQLWSREYDASEVGLLRAKAWKSDRFSATSEQQVVTSRFPRSSRGNKSSSSRTL